MAKEIFCSVKCKKEKQTVIKHCMQCGYEFLIRRSIDNGKSNSNGHFCSRDCYEKFLCHNGRTTGRGSQWNKTRKEVLINQPFCALCATTKRLQVHHIIPFRITHDNNKNNLIALCLKHHKFVEYETVKILQITDDIENVSIVLNSILRESEAASRIALFEAIKRRNNNVRISA